MQRNHMATPRRVLSAMSVGLIGVIAMIPDSANGSVRLPGEYGTVWVTNRTFNNVAAFDAGTGDVVATVGVGAAPIGIVAPLGTGKVYSSDEGSDQVSVISRSARTRLATIPWGRGHTT